MDSETGNQSDNFQPGCLDCCHERIPNRCDQFSESGRYLCHRYPLAMTETIALDARLSTIAATVRCFLS
jgi:hypothetical protein